MPELEKHIAAHNAGTAAHFSHLERAFRMLRSSCAWSPRRIAPPTQGLLRGLKRGRYGEVCRFFLRLDHALEKARGLSGCQTSAER